MHRLRHISAGLAMLFFALGAAWSADAVGAAPAVAQTTAAQNVAAADVPATDAPTKAAPAAKEAPTRETSPAEDKLFDYRQITLDNGLKVISLEDFSCPVVNVQLWYHVGSKDEDPQRQGFAHMFEHMMFRGTDTLGPTDHFDFVRQTGGSCNAYTSFDQTVYHETLPAHQLGLALWLEAQRMAFLKIDQSAFDTERKIVEEERRMGLNQPFGSVPEKLMAALYEVHPYQWTPIGKIPHLRSSSVPELRAFWNRYYVPNNATLVVVGAVKHAEVQHLAERYFGWIARGDDPPRVSIREPLPTEASSVKIEEDNAPAPIIGMIYRTISIDHEDAVPLQILGAILVGDNSSRLYRKLVAENKLAVQTINFSNVLEQDGMFAAGAVLSPFGPKPDEARKMLEEEIERIRTEPVSPDELTKAKNQLMKQTVVSNLTVEGKASVLGSTAVLKGDVAKANRSLDEIRAVTAGDVLRVAKKYLAPERSLAMSIDGGGAGPLSASRSKTDEEDAPITAKAETNPPPPGRPGVSRPGGALVAAPISPPVKAETDFDYSTHTLSNGLEVIIVPNHEQPFVDVTLGLKAGAWTEDKPGTASMTLGMLTKGTASHTEAELAEELGMYAISLDGSAGMDNATISATCLSDHLRRTIKLLSEVVIEPTFPEEEFAKHRQQVRTGLAMAAGQPSYIAARELRRKLYGEHPYARTETGEAEDVDNLTIEDLQSWWKRFARPDMAVLIVSGDVESDQALKEIESAFSGWTAEGSPPEIELPPLPKPEKTHIYLIDRRTSTQAQIHVGQLGITREHPGYATSRVVNGYFGGAFNSRLNETIRVKKGLTYGARGGFSAQQHAGQFSVSTFSKTATTAEAVQAVLDEIKRLKEEAPSDEELGSTISYLLGSFPLGRETPQQVAQDLWLIRSHDLPEDYLDRQLSAIGGTTKEEALKLAQAIVDPDHLAVIVVGSAKKLKADLEKIAPVTVID